MSGPPYTKLFWGEYHRETNHFSREEHGAYLLLISEAWDHGGCIPGDEATLARLIKGTPEDWARLAPTLLARFRPARGRWRHPWISDQLGAFTDVSRKRSEAGKKGGSASVGKVSRNRQAIANQMPPYPDSDSEVESLAKPISSDSESSQLGAQARGQMSVEDMARWVYDALPPLSQRKTGHDSLRIRRAIEARVNLGEDARHVALAAYAYAVDRAHQRENGKFAAQLHKLIEVGFPPLWIQSAKSLAVPETLNGKPLIWAPPTGPIAPPAAAPPRSSIVVDGASFEIPQFEVGLNALAAELRVRRQLEIMVEWAETGRRPQLWQRNSWGPPPGDPRSRIWPSVAAYCAGDQRQVA